MRQAHGLWSGSKKMERARGSDNTTEAGKVERSNTLAVPSDRPVQEVTQAPGQIIG